MDCDTIKHGHQYKQCAGKDCNRIGTQLLKIRYLNKSGYFCNVCKKELLDLGLVIGEDNEISSKVL
jgi:hypothetical protein